MLDISELHEITQRLLDHSSGGALVQLVPLTPDASLRRYFRATTDTERSVIVMVFDSVTPPRAGGENDLPSNTAFFELSEFFSANDLNVPRVLASDPAERVYLVEDFGSELLINTILEGTTTPSTVIARYQLAIQAMVKLNSLPKQREILAFRRYYDRPLFAREIEEFPRYILQPAGLREKAELAVVRCFDRLLTELVRLPQLLSHRDYHSWNLVLLSEDEIGILDFQDALLAPRTYDLISLLNDRDTDRLLGAECYDALKRYFVELTHIGAEFEREFALTALQRDLKVAGRFAKFCLERGLFGYAKWIPGTVHRVRENLHFLGREYADGAAFAQLAAIVDELTPQDLQRFSTPAESVAHD